MFCSMFVGRPFSKKCAVVVHFQTQNFCNLHKIIKNTFHIIVVTIFFPKSLADACVCFSGFTIKLQTWLAFRKCVFYAWNVERRNIVAV